MWGSLGLIGLHFDTLSQVDSLGQIRTRFVLCGLAWFHLVSLSLQDLCNFASIPFCCHLDLTSFSPQVYLVLAATPLRVLSVTTEI